MPQPQQLGIQVKSTTYTTAHGNTRSLTHWARPGIKPATSWILVGFVSPEPRQEFPRNKVSWGWWLSFLSVWPFFFLPFHTVFFGGKSWCATQREGVGVWSPPPSGHSSYIIWAPSAWKTCLLFPPASPIYTYHRCTLYFRLQPNIMLFIFLFKLFCFAIRSQQPVDSCVSWA